MKIKDTKTAEMLVYPFLLLALLWSIYLGDTQLNWELYRFGVHPRHLDGLIGIVAMPLIHSSSDFHHILNNSLPVALLLGSLIYFYRSIAFKVFAFIWIGTGLLVWLAAGSGYHIGISGVIYGLFSFLFVSGALRKYKPLMGVSLVVIFLYGSLIWGILPLQKQVSWEGHLFGLGLGIFLAFRYRKEGPQAPKYRYEIEEEQGIEPPDLEEQWRKLNEPHEENPTATTINYHFIQRKPDSEN